MFPLDLLHRSFRNGQLNKTSFAGYTLFTYLNILTSPSAIFTGYISSMVKSSHGYYGAALHGYSNAMQFVSFLLNYFLFYCSPKLIRIIRIKPVKT